MVSARRNVSARAIVCVFSAGLFAGSIWTKVLQSRGDMKKGFRRSPDKSVYLRHIARIFRIGIPNILMQSAYTFYIPGLNLILSTFSDQAVTALGLYYKRQIFFGSMLSVFTTDSLVIAIMDKLNKWSFHAKKAWIYGLFRRENNLKSAFP